MELKRINNLRRFLMSLFGLLLASYFFYYFSQISLSHINQEAAVWFWGCCFIFIAAYLNATPDLNRLMASLKLLTGECGRRGMDMYTRNSFEQRNP